MNNKSTNSMRFGPAGRILGRALLLVSFSLASQSLLLVSSTDALSIPASGIPPLPCTPRWSRVSSPNPTPWGSQLTAVAAHSETDAWAVGAYDPSTSGALSPLVEHWNGSHWDIVSAPLIAGGML